jgi:hypothetical protein
MPDTAWERIDPLIARWKKFEPTSDAERLAALEHSPTSELQRLIREVDESKADIDAFIAALEKKYDAQYKLVFYAFPELLLPPDPPRRKIDFHSPANDPNK